MKSYLKVVAIALSVFLLGACGSNSSGGNNSFVADGGPNNGGNEGGNNGGNGSEIIKSVSISYIKNNNGTYSFKPEFKNVTDSNIKYSWDFGGRIYEPAQRSVSNPVISYVDDGDYDVQLKAELEGEVLESNTITIYNYQPLKVKSNYGYMGFTGVYSYSAGAIKDKKLYLWGRKLSSEYATSYNIENESIKDISYTSNSYIILTYSGKVYTCGGNFFGTLGDGTNKDRYELKIVEALKNVVIKKIYTSASSVYAIDSEGQVWSWGDNAHGQLGIGSLESSNLPVQIMGLRGKYIVSIAAGYNSAYAIDKDGQVYSWGNNADGQLGIDNTTTMTSPVKIDAFADKVVTAIYVNGKDYQKAFAIDKDGKLYGWGSVTDYGLGNTPNNKVPNLIEALKDKFIVLFTMNDKHSMYALDVYGKLYSWGNGTFGELGHGNWNGLQEPKLIEYFSNNGIVIRKIIAGTGTNSIFAIDTEGKVYAWGDNFYGQLGINGKLSDYNTPVQVKSLEGNRIVFMPSDSDITPFAISDTGKIFAAGMNYFNEFGSSSMARNLYYEFVDISNILN